MPQVEQLWLEEDLEEDAEMEVLAARLLMAATILQWLGWPKQQFTSGWQSV